MAGISTHVLDNHFGRPGVGMRIDFSAWRDGKWERLKSFVTNADGRTDTPVLPAEAAAVGQYELAFHVGAYYEGKPLPEAPFVDAVVPVRFAVFDPKQHYHVPLLCSPWGCSTYRGS